MFEFQFVKTKACGATIVLKKNTYTSLLWVRLFLTALVDELTLFLIYCHPRITRPFGCY